MPANSPTIRSATSDDYESIAQLIFRSHTISFAAFASQAWVQSRNIDEYRARWKGTLEQAEADDATFVALLDGEIVGTVRVGPVNSPDYDAQLNGMHVEPALTGKGVGGLLMSRAMQFINDQGFKRVELGVIVGNTGARRFYEAHGWSVAKELPDGIEGVPIAIYELIRYGSR